MKQRWGLIGLVAVISFLSGGWLLQRGAGDGNVYQQARLFDDVLGHVNTYLRRLDRRDRPVPEGHPRDAGAAQGSRIRCC